MHEKRGGIPGARPFMVALGCLFIAAAPGCNCNGGSDAGTDADAAGPGTDSAPVLDSGPGTDSAPGVDSGTLCTPAEVACAGGLDEDCDGDVDCADADCAADPLCMMMCAATETLCADMMDDDCDGDLDCADADCVASPLCCMPMGAEAMPPGHCSDLIDNDCDMAVDCADTECAGVGGCP